MNKNENLWFIAFLIILVILLSILDTFSIFELGVLTVAYIANWGIMSYIIQKTREGKISTNYQGKELFWFSSVLAIFILSIIMLGSPSSYELIIAVTAFTLIWVSRSIIVKKFAIESNASII